MEKRTKTAGPEAEKGRADMADRNDAGAPERRPDKTTGPKSAGTKGADTRKVGQGGSEATAGNPEPKAVKSGAKKPTAPGTETKKPGSVGKKTSGTRIAGSEAMQSVAENIGADLDGPTATVRELGGPKTSASNDTKSELPRAASVESEPSRTESSEIKSGRSGAAISDASASGSKNPENAVSATREIEPDNGGTAYAATSEIEPAAVGDDVSDAAGQRAEEPAADIADGERTVGEDNEEKNGEGPDDHYRRPAYRGAAKTSAHGPAGAIQPFWIDLMAIIGAYIVAMIAGGLIGLLFTKISNADAAFAQFLGMLISYPAAIIFSVWILRRRTYAAPVLSFSLKKADPTMILWGIVLLAAASVVVEPLLSMFPERYLDSVNDYVSGGGGLAMFTVVILAPVAEEMFFRGIVQESSSREYGPLGGILIGSLLFAVVHLVPQMIVNAFVAGIILGYIYFRTKSLVPVIIIHAFNNALSYIFIRMGGDGGDTLRHAISNDGWYWTVYTLCAALFAVALVNLWLHLNRHGKKTMKPKS